MMPKFLLLGSNGFLGSYFSREKLVVETQMRSRQGDLNQDNKIVTHVSSLETFETIESLISSTNATHILNCIAIANFEKAESQPEAAFWANTELPRKLAEVCLKYNKTLIHFSTDAVFGDSFQFKTENHPTNPTSVYAASKLAGEVGVRSANSETYIFRINFFGQSPNGNSLYDFIKSNLAKGKTIYGFTDVYFTPIYAKELTRLVVEAVQKCPPGVYHLVGNERLSKYDFALRVADTLQYSRDLIKPSSMSSVNTINASLRPNELSLSNTKISKMGIVIPSLADGLTGIKNEF